MPGKVSGGNPFKTFITLLQFMFTLRGALSITAIIILVTSGVAIKQSFEQKSIMPIFTKIGGELLNHDNSLYIESKKIEQNNGIYIEQDEKTFFGKIQYFWKILQSFSKAFLNLWYLWFFLVVFYNISIYLIINDESRRQTNVIIAVGLLVVLQVFGMILNINKEEYTEQEKNLIEDAPFYPFRGLIKFVGVSPKIFNPVYEYFSGENQTMNETINITDQTEDILYITDINMTGA